MQRTSLAWLSLAAVGTACVFGCATGIEPSVDEGYLASTPSEAGAEETTPGVSMPAPSQPDDEEDAGGGEVDAGGGADAGTKDGGADAGPGPGPGGGTGACASPNVCTGATDLGSIRGDKGADVKTAQGSGSQWFKVRVTEDDSGVTGMSLAAKATLTSPPGTNFDLYVYTGGSSNVECSAVSKASTTAGTDTASVEFGESGIVSNGSDDSRWVTIEVRWVSGTCAPTAKWTLTVNGNTL